MILDHIKNCDRYCDSHPLFAQAFEFLESEAHLLEDGKYELDGENMFATIVTAPLKEMADAKLEAHDKYIDIQMVLEGCESFGIANRERMTSPIGEMCCTKDIIFFNDTIDTVVSLTKGDFMVLYPDDCHAPTIGSGSVRKVVVKVLVTRDEF